MSGGTKAKLFLLLTTLGSLFLVTGCDPWAPFEGDGEKEARYRVEVVVEASSGTTVTAANLSQEGTDPPPIVTVPADEFSVYRTETEIDQLYLIEAEIDEERDDFGNPWILIVSVDATVPASATEWFSVTIEYTDLSYFEPQTTTIFEETYFGDSTDDPTIDALETFPR